MHMLKTRAYSTTLTRGETPSSMRIQVCLHLLTHKARGTHPCRPKLSRKMLREAPLSRKTKRSRGRRITSTRGPSGSWSFTALARIPRSLRLLRKSKLSWPMRSRSFLWPPVSTCVSIPMSTMMKRVSTRSASSPGRPIRNSRRKSSNHCSILRRSTSAAIRRP
jgi:hypothetical protein